MAFSRIKQWVANEVLRATDLNAEFDNVIQNFTPTGMDDISANISAMQTSVDPGGLGTESLATNLTGELQRLRYAIKRLVSRNGTNKQWYEAPPQLGTVDIADGAVTLPKLPDGVFTADTAGRAKFANGFVGPLQVASLNFVQANMPASATITQTTPTVVPGLTAPSITTTGRPVEIKLQGQNIGAGGFIRVTVNGSSNSVTLSAYLYIYRDGVAIGKEKLEVVGIVTPAQVSTPGGTQNLYTFPDLSIPASSISFFDSSATAGNHTYAIYAQCQNTTVSVQLANISIIAKEVL
jgi:hypothetical protein